MIKTYIQFITEKKEQEVGKKLIDDYGVHKIFTVNGEKVRDLTKGDEEFGLCSSHPYFPNLIPKNEIWIEDDVKEDEREMLIHSELYKLKLISNGEDKWDAYHKAEKQEKKLRERSKSKDAHKTDEKADDKIYVKEWGKIKSEDLTVWLVDAEKVRNKYKTDYLEGGHGYVYKWIPNNEIWIENGLKDKEIPFVLLHEFVERTLMKEKDMKYDNAHNIAAKVEWNKRPNDCNKKEMEDMTEKEALEIAKNVKKKE